MSGSPAAPESGALLEDEANQTWLVPPNPSLIGSASASASSSSVGSELQSAAQRRRQTAVTAFLKQGESNETFKVKAPSILTTYWSPQQQQQQAESKRSSSRSRDASPPPTSESAGARGLRQRQPRPSGFHRLVSNITARLRRGRRRRSRVDNADRADSSGSSSSSSSSSSSEEDDADDDDGDAAPNPPTALDLDDSDDDVVNFATVDWGRQDENDMLQYHRLHEPLPMPKLTPGGRGCCGVFWSKVKVFFRLVLRLIEQGMRAGQGWALCGLVGLFTGLLASMIDMCVHWVIDFRVGICADNIFLSNRACCSAVTPDNFSPNRDNHALQQVCPLWHNWDVVLDNWGVAMHPMADYITTYAVYVIISGILAGTSWWVVASWARYAAGSGIPEIKTILGGVVIRRVLGGWTLLTKCVALVLSVSSGLSVGKEGPFVHIGACVANLLCQIFPRYRRSQAKANEILSAACAAGVAVAFGAPIGGILYSLEEVSSYFPHKTMWRAFFCAIIASISVTYIDPYQDGKLVQFQIDYTNPWQWFEMIPFFFIGVLGGLAGAFFIWANLKITRARKASFLARIPLVEVCIVAMLSSVIKFQSSYTRGNTTNLLEALFSDCSNAPAIDPLDMCNVDFMENTIGSLFFATMVTLLLTTYTIGLPIPSGLLIPSLTTGAAMGRLVGTCVRWLQLTYPSWGFWSGCQSGDSNCITPGIYALVGGASVLGGVTRMTIALVVIMFEITGGLTYLLPIMVAVMTSKVVGDYFGTDSIYEGAIEALRYPFLDVKHDIPSSLRVKDAMTAAPDLLVLPIHGHTVASLHEALRTMSALNISGFPVVTTVEEMLVVGYITRSELKSGLRYSLRHGGSGGSGPVVDATPCYFAMLDLRYPRTGPYVDLSGLLDPAPVQVSEGMALYRLHDMFCKLGLRYCLVARFGQIIGICTKKDIITHLHHYEHEQEAHAKKGHVLPH